LAKLGGVGEEKMAHDATKFAAAERIMCNGGRGGKKSMGTGIRWDVVKGAPDTLSLE